MQKQAWAMIWMGAAGVVAAPLAIAQSRPEAAASEAAPQATRVLDRAGLQRLQRNSGVTLQWIGWDQRGRLSATMRGRTLWLDGGQAAAAGASGRVSVQGWVREVGARHFDLVGSVIIDDTPDAGRRCVRTGTLRFAVTQNRRYWRMQRMTECDGLTDYVDVYL